MSQLPKIRSPFGNGLPRSFQLGGQLEISEDEKKSLFPYFAYVYSKQLNPEKYGNLSMDQWVTTIQDSDDDIQRITEAAGSLTDDDWVALKAQYKEAMDNNKIELAAKGAKLKKLKELQKSSTKKTPTEEVNKSVANPTLTAKAGAVVKKKLMPKGGKKKCSCGCDMIKSKADGGKIIETCACKCGGKMKKKK